MASLSIIFFLLLCVLCIVRGAQQQQPTEISLGSSLSLTSDPTSWVSPSGRFAFGFYQQGTGFAVGIWLKQKPTTIVWTANRDDPPVSANSMIVLTKNGKLVLRIGQGEEKPIANITDAASFASMLDNGNLVLYNKSHQVIWDSFRYPTDTILGGQTLLCGLQLFSSSSENNHSSGRFRLAMQPDGNLVLYPVDTGFVEDAYWASNTATGLKNSLYLNNTGLLQLINDTTSDILKTLSGDSSSTSNVDNSTIYRATLDIDGVFRLYSHRFDDTSGEKATKVLYQVPDNACKVKGFCGFNSFCTFNDKQPYCDCLPGSDFIDPNQKSLGCIRNYEGGCIGGKRNAFHFNMTTMEDITWGDRPYFDSSISADECSNSCLEDCYCDAALFSLSDSRCKKQQLPLRYVRRTNGETSTTVFLKVGIGGPHDMNQTSLIPLNPSVVIIRSKKEVIEIYFLTCSLVLFSFLALIASGLFLHKLRFLRYKRLLENGEDGLTRELTLQLFSYNELKEATSGFKEELGKGSFGAVYKGSLYKGKRLVAVKRLEKLVEEGEREFQAEMRAIGRTHHKNLVRLLGYCAMDRRRLLVYEYMSNGSLADLLFKSSVRPNWKERLRIAVDVARGILYLHEECEAPIIHCDIKPQNILMDDSWTAKISDFGLAKLLMPDQTRTFTIIRGTRGYLAPEWHRNAPISVKSDVYSYGIVLLEITFCRRNMDINAKKTEEIILSTWVYNCFAGRELNKLVIGEEDVDRNILEKMVKVALWCIQDEPALRPSIKNAVLMLEGITDIPIPPSPSVTSI